MISTPCPAEPALWPAVSGDTLSASVAQHLEQCLVCRERIARLRRQTEFLRRTARQSCDAIGAATSFAASPEIANLLPSPHSGVRREKGIIAEINLTQLRREDSSVPPPARIGRYPVQRLLKSSGQAAVYLGRHPALDIDVVIKWAHATVPNAASRSRLAEEARVLAALRQPHLATLYDFDIHEDRPFLVLEYVPGEELSQHARALDLKPVAAARLVAKVARAVAEAHRGRVLHLDLKPENIIIDAAGEPKLIDFGVARAFRGPETSGSISAGTLEYMAPEQLVANSTDISERTDVYGLGGILYEVLTGRIPDPVTVWGAAPHACESEFLLANGTPAPLALARICQTALHPDPARRFATASEFAAALESFATSRRRAVRAVVAALLLLSAAALLPARVGSTFQAAGGPLMLQVIDGNDVDELPRAQSVALRAGLQTRAILRTPAGAVSALFIVTPQGVIIPVTPLECSTSDFLGSSEGEACLARFGVTRTSGATLFISCFSDDAKTLPGADLVAAWGKQSPPTLPAHSVVRFDADSVEYLAEKGDGPLPDEPPDLRRRVRSLQRTLARVSPGFSAVLIGQGAN